MSPKGITTLRGVVNLSAAKFALINIAYYFDKRK